MRNRRSLRFLMLSSCLLLSGCIFGFNEAPDYTQYTLTNTTTSVATTAPDNFFWDSGEQQCQLDRRKIVYHYWLEPANDPDGHPGAVWLLRYDVWYEFRARIGGWTQEAGLEDLDYHIVYQGGQKPPEQGRDTRPGGDRRRSTHTLLWGYDFTPIESVTLIASAAGGIQKTWTWPNPTGGNECESS